MFDYLRLRSRCLTMAAIMAGIFLQHPAHAAPDDSNAASMPAHSAYVLGEGLKLGDSGFNLGGYASLVYANDRDAEARATFSHASLFLWWEGQSRWKFFSELDYENALAWSRRDPDKPERYLALERIYADYSWSDAIDVRLGKFLTPIGRWNTIHADPLVWTTSRPLMTEGMFPGNATGGMLRGELSIAGMPSDYSLYGSFGPEWRSDPAQDPFKDAAGLHLNIAPAENLQLGFSFASFEQRYLADTRQRLGGVDFLWAPARFEFSGEAAVRHASSGTLHDEKGTYLQAVVPLYGKLYGVVRHEYYHADDAQSAHHRQLAGFNYRWSRALSLKAEYVRGSRYASGYPQGFLGSFNVLF